jgi:hypothetical protein
MERETNDILTFLFWANFAAFALHIMDETIMAGGLVAFIQRHFWSGFRIGDFAVANGVWLVVIAISNVLYDWQGKWLAVVPMAFVWERCFNALFHVVSTFWLKEYSPGLATGVLFFVILYLIARYGLLRGHMRPAAFWGSAVPALVFETTFVSSMWWAH